MHIQERVPVPVRAALAALLVLGACGAEGREASRRAGPTTASTTATSGPTASTATGTVACPSGTGAAAQAAEQAASCLYRAWRDADRASAEVFASVDVADTLFSRPWAPPEGQMLPCTPDPEGEGRLCGYDHHGVRYTVAVRRSEGGWRVTQLREPPP